MPVKTISVSREALAIIVDFIQSISYGTVTLIVQDGRLLQIERTDKIRLDCLKKFDQSAGCPADKRAQPARSALGERQIERLRGRLTKELQDLAFGQVILIVKDKVLVQIERTEKQRLTGLEGIYGDGI